eukprot:COSAG04_NODE_18661_length_435_cov_1.229167_1_plen_44_part_10
MRGIEARVGGSHVGAGTRDRTRDEREAWALPPAPEFGQFRAPCD